MLPRLIIFCLFVLTDTHTYRCTTPYETIVFVDVYVECLKVVNLSSCKLNSEYWQLVLESCVKTAPILFYDKNIILVTKSPAILLNIWKF